MLSNLLNNAAKYTPAGGQVAVTAWREDQEVVVAVRDTGLGIPPQAMPTLFDMFTQVGDNMARSQGGLGIGLSLVKRLVQLHGGSVGASSEGAGLGSTFTVRLPLAAPALPAAPAPASAAHTATLRIMVVDDNADAGQSLASLLTAMGHVAHVATSGQEGLALARRCRPELAFLDIGMPGMDGHELARRLRADAAGPGAASLKLVALTGWGTREDVANAQAAGFDLHLTKPVDIDALRQVFVQLLGAQP